MTKFKVGDVIKPLPCENGFLHNQLDIRSTYTVEGFTGRFVNVSGEFLDGGDGLDWNEDWFELADSAPQPYTAESLRKSILDIRSKREALQQEILRLDAQEKEAVEKLKELGFVLYEDNVSKETVATENKAVLYAEDIEEDMNNCENWENGDILEVITHDNTMVPFGALVKHDDRDGDFSPYTKSEYVDRWAINDMHLKFHSRPVK